MTGSDYPSGSHSLQEARMNRDMKFTVALTATKGMTSGLGLQDLSHAKTKHTRT